MNPTKEPALPENIIYHLLQQMVKKQTRATNKIGGKDIPCPLSRFLVRYYSDSGVLLKIAWIRFMSNLGVRS